MIEGPDCAVSAREWRAARAQPYVSYPDDPSDRFRRVDNSARALVECYDHYDGQSQATIARQLGPPSSRFASSRWSSNWSYSMGQATKLDSDGQRLVLSFDSKDRLRQIERPFRYSSSD
jgi:hypothetical protein